MEGKMDPKRVLVTGGSGLVGKAIDIHFILEMFLKTTYSIDETMIHNGAPHWTNSGYAYAKQMVDGLFSAIRMEVTAIIPTNIFSPHDNFSIEDTHVLPALVHKAYTANGRKYTHRHPVDKLFIQLNVQCQSYSVIEDFLSKPEYSAQTSSLALTSFVQYDTSKINGQMKKTVNNAKLRRYRPDFTVKETCDWFAANHDRARK
uniref:NAD-dependent epimerase/dehydratase domain-containing protein n=1 Tax=Electrophorus electricus TaxID=8005 RepID=A0A4W4F760_ELEEL